MKLVGFLCVALAGGCVGWQKAVALRRRAAALSAATELIRFCMWQLQYTATPLPELAKQVEERSEYRFLKLGGSFAEKVGRFSFAEAWREAVASSVKFNNFTEEDVRLLQKFGDGLGKTDLEGQCTHGELCLSLLEKQQRAAAQNACDKAKVTVTAWLAGSTAVALLLL